jgi:porin
VVLGKAAQAEDAPTPAPPPLSFEALETVDYWRNTEGGLKVGDTTLNKIRLAATFDGSRAGLPGWRAHAQMFRTNGESLSGGRLGDIQTASNIEAYSVTRLMDAWVERDFGDKGLVRVGIQDLNLDFDSIDTAGLFLNSSHGIAPDLSQTGANGPSIFPEGGLAVEGIWNPTFKLSLKLGVFDGAPGDPAHPRRFVAVKLSAADGALVIGEADYRPSAGTVLALGAWGYTADVERIAPGAPPQHGQSGAYAFAQVRLSPAWSGWVRAGVADDEVNPIGGYLGGGVVRTGVFGRAGDQFGLAVAHARLGAPIRSRDGLPAAETAFEATYALQVRPWLILQPDLQYIVHPASQAGLRNALAVGLRITVDFKHPDTAPFPDD